MNRPILSDEEVRIQHEGEVALARRRHKPRRHAEHAAELENREKVRAERQDAYDRHKGRRG